ncbi:hypothetical protein ACTQ2S_08085 [Parolsenella catena]|uniref:hypothetical protein n=1 Tax=Parolsenella catena TaxID=2003188 RepID=UPI003F9CC4CA
MKGCVGSGDIQGIFDLRLLISGDHGGDRFQLGVDALEAVADFGHVRLADNHRRRGKADAGDLRGADPGGFERDVAAQATLWVSDEGPHRFRILLRGDEVLKAVAFGDLDFVELLSLDEIYDIRGEAEKGVRPLSDADVVLFARIRDDLDAVEVVNRNFIM